MSLASASSDAWWPWQDQLWESLWQLSGSEGLSELAWVTELMAHPDCRNMWAVPFLPGFSAPLRFHSCALATILYKQHSQNTAG